MQGVNIPYKIALLRGFSRRGVDFFRSKSPADLLYIIDLQKILKKLSFSAILYNDNICNHNIKNKR